jgi:hypothetical protein
MVTLKLKGSLLSEIRLSAVKVEIRALLKTNYIMMLITMVVRGHGDRVIRVVMEGPRCLVMEEAGLDGVIRLAKMEAWEEAEVANLLMEMDHFAEGTGALEAAAEVVLVTVSIAGKVKEGLEEPLREAEEKANWGLSLLEEEAEEEEPG